MKKTFLSLTIFLITVVTLFISADDIAAKEIGFEEGNSIPQGFVEENPWESNFVDVDIQNFDLNTIENYEIYSEEEAKEVIEKIQELQNNASSNESIMFNNQQENDLSISPLALKSKSWYRAEFKAMALYAGTINLPTSGNYLNHSLQDNPSNRTNGVGSGHSNALSLTRMYTTISVPMASEIDKAKAAGKTSTGGSGSIATSVSNVGLDFYLTYGRVAYTWGASKLSSGSWAVNIVITDTYDYAKIKKVSTTFPQNMIDLANNHAADAQTAGAIVPYNISTVFYQDYKPK